MRHGPLLAENTTFKEVLSILMRSFGQFEVPRERTKSLQQMLVSCLWQDVFQIIQDGLVRFRIFCHHRPVLVMANMNKKIAPAWDEISIPAEDEAGQNECGQCVIEPLL